MITTSTQHISEAVREGLRALLHNRVLQKTDTAFEMGYEKCKEDIRIALEIYTGGQL
jgi:Arc/MetJ-type ribon-helix-helix transcriptional regulator